MKRKATFLIAAMLVAVVAVGGIALAETLDGGPGDNRLIGSNGRDQIDGNGGEDFIKGLRSRDTLNGGAGDDTIIAGPRDEAALDTVFGGRGDDVIDVPTARRRRTSSTAAPVGTTGSAPTPRTS